MPTALDDPPSRVYPLTASESPPMNIYSYSSKDFANPTVRAKRRQVKNACTNCQRACKKCDDARPCLRCVKYGIGDECVDSQRKERKKGVKRGPYKKRDGKANNAEAQTGPPPVSSSATPPQMPQYTVPMPSYPAWYPAYTTQERPQDPAGALYPPAQYYLTPMPTHQDVADYQNQGYYQSSIYHSAPYMMQRAQLPYPVYSNAVPQKPGPNDVLSPHGH